MSVQTCNNSCELGPKSPKWPSVYSTRPANNIPTRPAPGPPEMPGPASCYWRRFICRGSPRRILFVVVPSGASLPSHTREPRDPPARKPRSHWRTAYLFGFLRWSSTLLRSLRNKSERRRRCGFFLLTVVDGSGATKSLSIRCGSKVQAQQTRIRLDLSVLPKCRPTWSSFVHVNLSSLHRGIGF